MTRDGSPSFLSIPFTVLAESVCGNIDRLQSHVTRDPSRARGRSGYLLADLRAY